MFIKWRKGLDIDLDINNSIKDILMDWEEWLNEIKYDTIASVVVTPSSDIVITNISFTDTIVEFTAEAGASAVAGDTGTAVCIITTNNGQKEPRTILFNLIDDL
jgi:hypothetical protein